jgi:O-antigen/teichoic acid export membrane protein
MKLRLIRLLGGAAGGVATITLGTGISQLIALAVLPALSRLFTPVAFGLFSVLSSIVAILLPAVALRLEFAIPLPADESTAASLTRTAVSATVVVSALGGLGIWALIGLGPLEELRDLSAAPIWAGILLAESGLFAVFSAVALRLRAYRPIATRSVLQSAANGAFQLVAGIMHLGPTGLVAGSAAGRAVGIAALARVSRPYLRRPVNVRAWSSICEYWRFPVVFAPSAVLNSVGLAVPIIFVTAHFGVASGGQFGMSERILALPATLIIASFTQVLSAEVASRRRSGVTDTLGPFLHASAVLALIAVPLAAVIWLIAPLAVPIVLGPQWDQVG